MNFPRALILSLIPILCPAMPPAVPTAEEWKALSGEQRLANVRERREAEIKTSLATLGLAMGDAVFLRVMKESHELELWMKPAKEPAMKLYRSYRIARWSGTLGPKQKEGDGQAPEGLYAVTPALMNPRSNYHLSMNIGYPNAHDRALGRTGSLIMIHGKDVSLGCFAMTDAVIEEIYLLVAAALKAGQPRVPVHCFPFRMTPERMAAAAESEWIAEWRLLLAPWDAFERTHTLPTDEGTPPQC